MNRGVFVATSGSIAQERAMDIIASNLANMNTHGYKADRLLFQSYLQKASINESTAPTPEQVREGVPANGTNDIAYMVGSQSYTDFTQGALQKSGNDFDLGLDGDGFIAVQTPMGERYTRGGAFKIGATGELVTADGYPVSDEGGSSIPVGDTSFAVQEDGTVVVGGNTIGRIKVVNFNDYSKLNKEGQGLFSTTPDAETAEPTAKVRQGYLEVSNINPVVEMTRMITALRTYEAFQKTIHSHDDMTSRLIADVGRP